MDEIWKDIEGFEGVYKISSFGTVKSFQRSVIGTPLRQAITEEGYAFVGPVIKNKRKYVYIHTAVAKYFISNPDNGEVVNHKDGNRLNNHVDNLEWVSYRENQCHARTVLNKGSKSSRFYGVHFKSGGKRRKRWGAILCFDKKQNTLGTMKLKKKRISLTRMHFLNAG